MGQRGGSRFADLDSMCLAAVSLLGQTGSIAVLCCAQCHSMLTPNVSAGCFTASFSCHAGGQQSHEQDGVGASGQSRPLPGIHSVCGICRLLRHCPDRPFKVCIPLCSAMPLCALANIQPCNVSMYFSHMFIMLAIPVGAAMSPKTCESMAGSHEDCLASLALLRLLSRSHSMQQWQICRAPSCRCLRKPCCSGTSCYPDLC
jgi:hypothetical protein